MWMTFASSPDKKKKNTIRQFIRIDVSNIPWQLRRDSNIIQQNYFLFCTSDINFSSTAKVYFRGTRELSVCSASEFDPH